MKTKAKTSGILARLFAFLGKPKRKRSPESIRKQSDSLKATWVKKKAEKAKNENIVLEPVKTEVVEDAPHS